MYCTYKCNIDVRSPNYCCRGKSVSITYSECVSVALVTRHAKGMLCVVLSSVSCLVLQTFSTFSHKQHLLRKKKSLSMKYGSRFSPQILSEIFLIPGKIRRDVIIHLTRFSCKVPVVLVRFYCKSNFLDRFLKKNKKSNFMKIS